MDRMPSCPHARTEQMVANELPDGLLVYDLERDQGHFLNQSAALIWQACDGQASISALSQRLAERGLPDDEAVVQLALERLAQAHLLRSPLPRSVPDLARRRALAKLGLAGMAALLPVVMSVSAPTPAMAASGTRGDNGGDNGGGGGGRGG